MSSATPTSIETLSEFVHEKLCAHEDLDPRCTPLFRTVVRKRGIPCGLFFHMQGPRLVRSYAVWSAEENRLFFYNGRGIRFEETVLSESPDANAMEELAAASS